MLRAVTLAALAAVTLAMAGAKAEATTLNFSLTGDYTANWVLDSNPTPSDFSNADGYTAFNGVAGIDPLKLVFYSATLGFGSGGVRISTTADPLTEVGAIFDFGGDQIFTGLLSAPQFAPGVFNLNVTFLTPVPSAATATLTVTAVPVATTPIPAALPLFMTALAGMGFVGWRRRHPAQDA
ncbi:hypothetical protein [Dongia sedimenti]|uniref:Secreted protein n=1 Tax=Dongia sedimenti TaxID=3064282 RepID=A0ABU0YRG8_9PROT|nr:hypothetical protein [Rhodospirillaceae bacterium R-7]